MILKLGMFYQGLKFFEVFINNGRRLTLTYFTAMSNLVANAFEWGTLLQKKMSFNGKRLAGNNQINRRFMFMK